MTTPAPDARPTRARPDDDPHLWLEAIDGPEAVAWVEARNGETLARFADAGFARDRDLARALLDRPDRIPGIVRYGDRLYNTWRDAAHPRELWRRTDEASYRAGAPEWETLLDLDRLAREEGEDWSWGGAVLSPDRARAILRLGRGGGDAVTLREFDLAAKAFVPDGFALAEAKGSAAWLDRDTLLLSSAHQAATRSGYARTVRVWGRGLAPGPILFEVSEDSLGCWAAVSRYDGERVVYVEHVDFFRSRIHLGDRTGPRTRLDLPEDAGVQVHRDRLAVRLRSPWTVAGEVHPADTVLAIGLSDFLADSRAFAVLWRPGERRALQHVFWSAGRLVIFALDDLRPVHSVHEPAAAGWSSRTLPGLPDLGSVHVGPLDGDPDEDRGELLAWTQGPLTPPSLLAFPTSLAAPALLRAMPPAFEAAGLAMSRHDAISPDGTRVPYVQVGPAAADGEAPVHLTAYGGFRVSPLPSYAPLLGKLWLERGGTTVVAHIRGGGEFGTPWHDAGRREGKARAHDDFAAVAADLVARGVTRPGRIAAEGGSNGGLLIANMLTRYPERFGALLCTIPLIDMRRYTKLLAGASWIAEYGDPDDPADWAFLQDISAYHAPIEPAGSGRRTPPILLVTSRRDDRVHPGHARKMAEKLRRLGHDPAFYEPAAGGHGAGKDNAEIAMQRALGLRFLARAIGWEPDAAG